MMSAKKSFCQSCIVDSVDTMLDLWHLTRAYLRMEVITGKRLKPEFCPCLTEHFDLSDKNVSIGAHLILLSCIGARKNSLLNLRLKMQKKKMKTLTETLEIVLPGWNVNIIASTTFPTRTQRRTRSRRD